MYDEVARRACHLWGIDKPSVELIAKRENWVYRVNSSLGTFALRIHRLGYRNASEIHSELLWMGMLAQNGLSVPKPVESKNGQLIVDLDGVNVSVLTWLNGTPISQLKIVPHSIFYQLGQRLATMHKIADAWQPPNRFRRHRWDLLGDNPTWGRFWQNPLLSTKQQARLVEFRNVAGSILQANQRLDIGLIHADLVPDNVLINEKNLQIIDFDDGGVGPRLFDLATITLRTKRQLNGQALRDAVIDGYTDFRSADLILLPLFEAIRACTYIGWNIARIQETEGLRRNSRFITEAELAISLVDELR